jgi:EmrB/QacA subfamily drug resistance transporter
VTLAVTTVTVVIITLDNTVLNVSIPTILRDFHTTLPSLQWVITGYALTFATLLLIGGRLGDLYGHRRIFIIGAALFTIGSLVASESTGVATLVLGEAIIEGIGASLMLPATLAILSRTFEGHERAAAFGVWGATGGTSAVLGPVVGGFLTTNYSWRWCFRINVIIAPLAIIGALIYMKRDERNEHRSPIDLPGALLVVAGMFLLVFGLSEGGTYGWWQPIEALTVAGQRVWRDTEAVSVVPVAIAVGVVILFLFVKLERKKERAGGDPLFEFGQLRHPAFRYGLLVTTVMSIGQFGLAFVLPVFLQEGKHLSAQENGFWQLPTGIFVASGAQVASRLTRRHGVTVVVRAGLLLVIAGFSYVAIVISGGLTFWQLVPGLALYGAGVGFATTQLTNVVLFDVDRDKSGVASGANSTARQLGLALGVAVIGEIMNSQTIARTAQGIRASTLSPLTKARAIGQLRGSGVGFTPTGVNAQDNGVLHRAFVDGVGSGARFPLLFAATLVALAFVASLWLPQIRNGLPGPAESAEAVGGMDGLELVEPERPIILFE